MHSPPLNSIRRGNSVSKEDEALNFVDAYQLTAHSGLQDALNLLSECVTELTDLRARCEKAEKDAEFYTQAQRACAELPEGWEITINLEQDAGTISLFNPDGDEVQFDSNYESIQQELRDAIDAAIAKDRTS